MGARKAFIDMKKARPGILLGENDGLKLSLAIASVLDPEEGRLKYRVLHVMLVSVVISTYFSLSPLSRTVPTSHAPPTQPRCCPPQSPWWCGGPHEGKIPQDDSPSDHDTQPKRKRATKRTRNVWLELAVPRTLLGWLPAPLPSPVMAERVHRTLGGAGRRTGCLTTDI